MNYLDNCVRGIGWRVGVRMVFFGPHSGIILISLQFLFIVEVSLRSFGITALVIEMFANGLALVFWTSPKSPKKSFSNGCEFSEIIRFSKTGSGRSGDGVRCIFWFMKVVFCVSDKFEKRSSLTTSRLDICIGIGCVIDGSGCRSSWRAK